MIDSVPAIIDALGGSSVFARIIKKGASTASEMKRSGRIDARYWLEIVAEANRRGLTEITYELLARLHAAQSSSVSLSQQATS
jgi:hypothetical protein